MAVAFAQPEVAEQTDRRVLRSRQMLVDALAKLLRRKDFDDISIQEIADEADLTRATFYLHFADKAALLQAMAAARFGEMLNKRGISRVGSTADVKAFAESVCEFVAKVLDCQSSSGMPLERAVIPVMEDVFRAGAKELGSASGLDPDTYGAVMAWAIYGAANRWARTPNRISADQMAKKIAALLKPIIQSATPARSR
jgi:AcrR family transcriptional regulator